MTDCDQSHVRINQITLSPQPICLPSTAPFTPLSSRYHSLRLIHDLCWQHSMTTVFLAHPCCLFAIQALPIARECHGLPWGFPGQPVPVPVETRTRAHGCGFQRVRVQVFKNPRVAMLNIYYIQNIIIIIQQRVVHPETEKTAEYFLSVCV